MLRRPHVDEVVDDDAAEVAEPQLPCDLIDRLKVRVIRIRLAVAGRTTSAAVDVDRDQRFGLIDDECATRRQWHLTRVEHRDLPFNVECVEERYRASTVGLRLGPVPHLRRVARCNDVQERRRFAIRVLAVHHDRFDMFVRHVANRTNEKIALRVENARRASRRRSLLEDIPQALEIREIAGEFRLRAVETRSSQNEPEALGEIELIENFSHRAALVFVLDLARHADAVHVRHHHHETTGNAEVTRERGALATEAFLQHLHDHFLTLAQRFLHQGTLAPRDLATNALSALLAGEVFRVKIGDVQEATGAFAVVDERGLDRGLDVRDASLIDIADVRHGAFALHEERLEPTVLKHRDTALVAGNIVHEHQVLRGWTPFAAPLSAFARRRLIAVVAAA